MHSLSLLSWLTLQVRVLRESLSLSFPCPQRGGPVVILLHFVYIICCCFVPSPCAHYACIFIYLPLTFFVSFHFILCATFYYHFPFAFCCICLTLLQRHEKFYGNSFFRFLFLFFYFVSFWLVLGPPKSWFTFARQRQLFLHTNNSYNISASRPAHCPPSLSLRLSVSFRPLERCCPISFGFWKPVSHFLSSQFGFRFFFFVRLFLVVSGSTLFFFFMLSLSSCPAAWLCLVAFISI